jgi:hypothetical protein
MLRGAVKSQVVWRASLVGHRRYVCDRLAQQAGAPTGKCEYKSKAGYFLVPGHRGLAGVDLAHGYAVVYWAD